MTVESIPTRSRPAEVDKRPAALVPQYRSEFALVLPAHVDPGAFVQMAISACRRDPDLEAAAVTSAGSFIHALRDAARLGHLPGTENYYLTVRKRQGKPEVLGIEGYRGVVERMYRTGAVSSVKVECVYENDVFRFNPGADIRPHHEVDWWGDRGALKGSYAYAELVSGGTSKVVVCGPKEIERAKKASATANSSYSPWVSDTDAMYLKTAAHRLEPWVPTSSEYLSESLRARAAAERVAVENPVEHAPDEVDADTTTGVVRDEVTA